MNIEEDRTIYVIRTTCLVGLQIDANHRGIKITQGTY